MFVVVLGFFWGVRVVYLFVCCLFVVVVVGLFVLFRWGFFGLKL